MSGINCWCGHYWHCGDCGTGYPVEVDYCYKAFEDYLSLRGGTIESAIMREVDKGMQETLKKYQHINRKPKLFRFYIAA